MSSHEVRMTIEGAAGTLSLESLKSLVAFADTYNLPPQHPISVHKDQSFNHPTDPGGGVRLSITARVKDKW